MDYEQMPEALQALRADLLPKQQQFADLVLSGRNYAEAYREAYDQPDISDRHVYYYSRRMYSDPSVARYLNEGRKWLAAQAIVSAEEMIHFCARTLRCKGSTLFDEDGRLRDEESDLVQEYDIDDRVCPDTGRVIARKIKVKLMSKKDAMAILTTLHKMLPVADDSQVAEDRLTAALKPTLGLPAPSQVDKSHP